MKVFISWSGDLSRRLAEVFRDWLPGVVQAVEPFFSPDDITKGDRWAKEISSKLEECKVGIFCITRNSINSPWLVFEAGAISKHLGSAKVCTVFFDLAPTDITGPLTQFQGAVFKKEEIFKVLRTINDSLEVNRLKPAILEHVFQKWWPDLEEKINTILTEYNDGERPQEIRSDKDILHEVLSIVRYLKSQPAKRENFILSKFTAPVFRSYRKVINQNRDLDVSLDLEIELGKRLFDLFMHLERDHGLQPGRRGKLSINKTVNLLKEIMATDTDSDKSNDQTEDES